MKEAGLKRKSKAASEIPSSSLADMAFLLLIFFMVSTVFPKEEQRDLLFPLAEETQRLEDARKDVLHVYIEADGSIFINDQLYTPDAVSEVVGPLRVDNQALVAMIRGDKEVPYVHIDKLQREFQEANALRLVFYTNLEQTVTRSGR